MLSVDLNAQRRSALRDSAKRDMAKLMPKPKKAATTIRSKPKWAESWKND
jgi:hypothetical protein